MVSCVVKGCKKHSASTKKSDGVTFHLFPTNIKRKHIWIDFVRKSRNEPQWQPNNKSVVCSNHFDNDDLYITNGGLRRVIRSGYPKKAEQGAGSSSAATPLFGPRYPRKLLQDSDAKHEDPLATEPPHTIDTTPQCRFCAEYSKDCIKVTDKDRPYLTGNTTALTISDLSVEVDFNDALPNTVCPACDKKLLEMFKFVKQVKEAQDSLISVRYYVIEVEADVKNNCEPPTPDDNDDIDSKDDTVDSLTVTDTVVKPNKPITIIKHKRKRVEGEKTHKKSKVTKESEEVQFMVEIKEEKAELAEMVEHKRKRVEDEETHKKSKVTKESKDVQIMVEIKEEKAEIAEMVEHKRKRVEDEETHKKPKVTKESEDVQFMVGIKEEKAEIAETVDTYETVNVGFDDTETDTKPSELELQTLLKVMK